MSNAAARRTVKIGNEQFELRDSTTPASYVDVILESAASHGTIMISLGAFNRDIPEEGLIDVTHRLRMNAFTAQRLHAVLGNIVDDLKRQADQQVRSAAENIPRAAERRDDKPEPRDTKSRKRMN